MPAAGVVRSGRPRGDTHDDVPGLDRVERLPGASHWVHHDEHERVNQLLIDFFAPALPANNPAR
jgi:pimeloyl-ACP methyl ester carboxylesterase